MTIRCIVACSGVLALLAGQSFAEQSTFDRLVACAGLPDDIQRGVCIRDLSVDLGFPSGFAEPVDGTAWRILAMYADTGVRARLTAVTSAEEAVPIGGGDVAPELWVVCRDNRFAVFLTLVNELESQSVNLEYGFDSDAYQPDQWDAIAPRSIGLLFNERSQYFVDRILVHDQLTLLASSPDFQQTATFQIGNAGHALQPVLRLCGL